MAAIHESGIEPAILLSAPFQPCTEFKNSAVASAGMAVRRERR